MKRITHFSFWIALGLILTQCASSQPPASTSKGPTTARTAPNYSLEQGCPLDKMTWLVVSKEANEEALSRLAAQLSEAALSDARQLNEMIASGNASPLDLSSTLRSLVENNAQTKVQVTDDFYKEYVNNRLAICAFLDALRKGSIKKDESARATENAFRKVGESFEGLSTNLKEKAARKGN
jgi:hypothetical protein